LARTQKINAEQTLEQLSGQAGATVTPRLKSFGAD
jgi:hypothetical protein